MQGKYRSDNKKNRSRFYILLSIILIVVVFKWGIPAFLDYVSGPEISRSSPTEEDTIPPQQPLISSQPEATNSSKILIEGYTEADVDTEIYLNDSLLNSQKSGNGGEFKYDVSLLSGENRIIVKARDLSGNTSQSTPLFIIFDNQPLKLTIDSPEDGKEFFGRNGQVVEIRGVVSKESCQVLVNNTFSTMEKGGKFLNKFVLSPGENQLKIVANDKAGNTTEKSIKVIYSP